MSESSQVGLGEIVIRTILGKGSLIFCFPLGYDHPSGTIVWTMKKSSSKMMEAN